MRAGRVAVVCALASVALPAGLLQAEMPADAMAFIRVVGDVKMEHKGLARPPIEQKGVELATGSGFVVTPGGLILTTLHVVDERPLAATIGGDEVEVSVEERRIEAVIGSGGGQVALGAYVVASDAESDLAALQVTAAELPYLPLGDSDALEPGRPVKVLGFPFGRQVEVGKLVPAEAVPEMTLTTGSLSATRANDDGERRFLQTDASINPGNSGGPMLDEDGYAVGVVRMKLAQQANSQGAGFAVSINVVKDFLEANGLIDLLPVTRLRSGALHSFDWKRLRVELPEGLTDTSRSRLRVDAGEAGRVSFRADRVATTQTMASLETTLLAGQELPGFLPAPPTVTRRLDAARQSVPPRRLGTAFVDAEDGQRLRVEYAILDLKREKVVARYAGPADAMAFNLSLIRQSLLRLEAEPMLPELPLRALQAGPTGVALEPASFLQGDGLSFPVPAGWFVEPVSAGACDSLPPALGVAASHPGDYTLVLRALRWGRGPAIERAVAACAGSRGRAAPAADATLPGYTRRFERFGVPIEARGVLVTLDRESLVLELEAPVAKLPIVEGLYRSWVGRVAESHP